MKYISLFPNWFCNIKHGCLCCILLLLQRFLWDQSISLILFATKDRNQSVGIMKFPEAPSLCWRSCLSRSAVSLDIDIDWLIWQTSMKLWSLSSIKAVWAAATIKTWSWAWAVCGGRSHFQSCVFFHKLFLWPFIQNSHLVTETRTDHSHVHVRGQWGWDGRVSQSEMPFGNRNLACLFSVSTSNTQHSLKH